jgi:hypothetical protein
MKMKESSRASQFYQSAADALQKVNPTGWFDIVWIIVACHFFIFFISELTS